MAAIPDWSSRPPLRSAGAGQRAILRGLRFIYLASLDDDIFEEWVGDFLWCFHTISATSKYKPLRDVAARIGRKSAQRWYSWQPATLTLEDADEVARIVCIVDAAKRLGVTAGHFDDQLRQRAQAFTASAYLGFDPAAEPPPSDIPEECTLCNSAQHRGAAFCDCGSALDQRSRYEVWRAALVLTYTGDGFGVPLGSSYLDVIRWLPDMRPYRGHENGKNPEFSDIAYGVTHVVYTLNNYNRRRLLPEWLPVEFDFLTENVRFLLEERNTELLGEFLDCLRVFGLNHNDPNVGAIVEYLLANQNPDGSWGDVSDPDILTRCHTTWTAIDGLRDYDWPSVTVMPDVLLVTSTDPGAARRSARPRRAARRSNPTVSTGFPIVKS